MIAILTTLAVMSAFAVAAVLRWRVRDAPPPLLNWVFWFGPYTAGVAILLAIIEAQVWYAPLVGGLLAGLHLVRYSNLPLTAAERTFSADELSDARGDTLEKAGVIVALLVGAWVLIWPRPLGLALAVIGAIPWAATVVCVVFRRSVAPLGSGGFEARATLTAPIFVGVAALAPLRGVHVLPGSFLILASASVIAGTALALIWRILAPLAFRGFASAASAILWAYVVGAASVCALNVGLDMTPGRALRTTVVAKEAVSRLGGVDLVVSNALAADGGDRLRVPRKAAAAIPIGSQICLDERRGAFGARWAHRPVSCP